MTSASAYALDKKLFVLLAVLAPHEEEDDIVLEWDWSCSNACKLYAALLFSPSDFFNRSLPAKSTKHILDVVPR